MTIACKQRLCRALRAGDGRTPELEVTSKEFEFLRQLTYNLN